MNLQFSSGLLGWCMIASCIRPGDGRISALEAAVYIPVKNSLWHVLMCNEPGHQTGFGNKLQPSMQLSLFFCQQGHPLNITWLITVQSVMAPARGRRATAWKALQWCTTETLLFVRTCFGSVLWSFCMQHIHWTTTVIIQYCLGNAPLFY